MNRVYALESPKPKKQKQKQKAQNAIKILKIRRNQQEVISRESIHYLAVFGKEAGDDVGLHFLGCRVDILGTNCKKLLKVKMGGGGGGGGGGGSRLSFSTCNHVRGTGKAPTVG